MKKSYKKSGVLARVLFAFAFAFAFAFVAFAPAVAMAGPRKTVWTVGDKSVKVLKDGSFITAKPVEMAKDTSQSIFHTTNTFINSAGYQAVSSSAGPVGLTSTPSISTTTAEGIALPTGKILYLRGTSDTDTVELFDDDTLSGSQLELGASSRVLGLNDVLGLLWDADTSTTGRWLEISFSSLD